MVGRFGDVGIDEFVLYWPQTWNEAPHEDGVFEAIASDVLPGLRANG